MINRQRQKNKTSKKKAVENTAKSKIDTRTRTIEVNVNSKMNIPTTNNKPKKSKKNKKIKTKQKSKKNINFSKIFKMFGIIVIIIGAIAFLCTSPLFNVTEIEVIGNENVSKEEIISLSQIKLEENMFKYIKSSIKQNVKGNAYIENVKIKRILPNKIQISVQERQVKFMVKLLEKYAYINSQGFILEVTSHTKEVPIIEGISTPEEEIINGKRLNNEDLHSLEVALNILSTCEENEISKFITSINVKNSSEYTVYMSEKAKTIHMGNDSNLGTKILYVKAILEAEDGIEGDIFVNGDLINGFQPFFRKKM